MRKGYHPYHYPSNTLGVRALASVAGNRNRPRIHLLLYLSISKQEPRAVESAGPKGKSSKDQGPRFNVPSSTRTQQRGVAAVPNVAQPAAAPAPPAAAPAQAADAQVAIAVAVDRPPEEDVAGIARFIGLPFVGDEVGVGEEVVQDIGVHDGHVRKRIAELVALDGLAALLTVGQMEQHLRGVEVELAVLLVLFDFPAVGHEGVGGTVDDVAGGAGALDELGDLGLQAAGRLAEAFQVFPSHTEAVEKLHGCRDFAVRRFGNQVPHDRSPLSQTLAGSPKDLVRHSREGPRNKPLSAMANAS